MPKYTYKCKQCKDIFESQHSMSERLTDCDKCDTLNSLVKIPVSIAVQYRDNKTGKIVNDYIEEAKDLLREEKEKISKEEFEND